MAFFSPWRIYRNIFKHSLSLMIFVLFRCSSQCQAWVPWCLQWTLVKIHFFLVEFNQMPCQCAVCKQCKTFITHLHMCVLSSVRTSCLPFTLTLNTLVSLLAPGTHGTASRIKQVRAQSISEYYCTHASQEEEIKQMSFPRII